MVVVTICLVLWTSFCWCLYYSRYSTYWCVACLWGHRDWKEKTLAVPLSIQLCYRNVFLTSIGFSSRHQEYEKLKHETACTVQEEKVVTRDRHSKICIPITEHSLNPRKCSLNIRLCKHLNQKPHKLADSKNKWCGLYRHATKQQIRRALWKCEVRNVVLYSECFTLFHMEEEPKKLVKNWEKITRNKINDMPTVSYASLV